VALTSQTANPPIDSYWDQHPGWDITGGILLCVVVALLIVTLLAQWKRRRQAERGLAERLRFETLSVDLSTAFINTGPGDDIDQSILHGLQRIAEFLGADRGNLAEFQGSMDTFHITHSWAAPGFEPLSCGPSVGRFPWCAEQLRLEGIVRCTRLEGLPEVAAVDRENFRKDGTKSLILLPLSTGDAKLGVLRFEALRTERMWTAERAQGLPFLGGIFALALLRRRAEQESEESEALGTAVLASLEGSVAVVDRSGGIIAVNGAWSRFARDHHAGPSASVSVGANYLDVCRRAKLAGDKRATEALIGIESVLNGGRTAFVLEYRCTMPDREVWHVMSVEPLTQVDGGAVISHRDITDRKRAELEALHQRRELAHLTRVAMMGELSASLAHELNQPLTAILSNAEAAEQLLTDDSPGLDEVRAIIADIITDDQRAGDVIHRLRGLLKKGEFERLPLDLNPMIQEVARLLHSDIILRHVELTLDLDPDLPLVCGDRVQLQQVALNLMVNGLDAMAEGPLDDRALVVRTQCHDSQMIRIAVEDRGSGLQEANIGRIFSPFYTTKPDGMGMGLSICRSIVEAHGGRLWAANNPERGATFSFTLPISEKTP
jgi:signal transduction histidine kinase